MSREIKFRFWDTKEGKWLGKDSSYWKELTFKDCRNKLIASMRQGNIIAEQYTGLTDKNGKEIYEGDIVYDIYTGDEVFIVGWDKDKASFMLADTADYPMAYFDEYDPGKDLEVIGNIHENPELLEDK